jgi:ferrochelatase
MTYDAVLLVGFGGPEKSGDVMPFLENVTRGRRIPRERLMEVAEHYYHLGGKSPINDHMRELKAALERELEEKGPRLPVYWGNRNWHPMLADTVRRMRDDGVRRALAFIAAAWSSYSSCRQYLENLEAARAEVGEGAPELHRLRLFYNHPGFLEPVAERVRRAVEELPEELRAEAEVLFTAHSIPLSMAEGSRYVAQLEEASALVAAMAGRARWRLVYQSRSGPPGQPWLEPDILDALAEVKSKGVVVAPIGFLSDHVEVLWDLDHEARAKAEELGLTMARAGTVGADARFVGMIRELILERTEGAERRALGVNGPMPDVCVVGCCPAPLMGRPTAGA